ncbi:tRNA pseudouridine(38-40) synthase TruA [Helicobacter sp. 12S02232-10]|uniref:tRNA pseudouridine(38-40) synthase TruA n=1 Tax=Helicobacter sp. 12S02232-10 TaxID=1476197 RepID=UPI000BA66911|nr:tRNA pseudouridine(38-40) synthase TruA [Helicobacter sp. 12S02232-10]PAF46729.1 tRNA pseudouridine(38-40) synthase TruA [Helicobacter sp. 12S02232-10]
MKRLVAKIAYDGSEFNGFARQRTHGIMSVSERIEIALKSMGIEDEIIGAGRTDKGVHSSGQIISFCVPVNREVEKIKTLLNQKLYPHILVKSIRETHNSFHPRFDAKKRGYRYIFSNDFKNPFISKYVSKEIYGDRDRIKEGLKVFLGRHNFAYFKKQGSDTKNDVREIFIARFYRHTILSISYNVIYLEAEGFLRAQVRLMIGAVLAYSRGEITFQDLNLQLKCKKRVFTHPVSPNGLYLAKIIY